MTLQQEVSHACHFAYFKGEVEALLIGSNLVAISRDRTATRSGDPR